MPSEFDDLFDRSTTADFFRQLQEALQTATETSVASGIATLGTQLQQASDDLAKLQNQFSSAPSPSLKEQVDTATANVAAAQDLFNNATKAPNATSNAQTTYQRLAYVDTIATTLMADPLGPQGVRLPGGRLVRYAEDVDRESDNPTFMLDALIFIQGVEVADCLMGGIQISKNTIEGHNRATFTLDNAADRFVWTEQNLADIFGKSNPSLANDIDLITSKFTQNEDIKRTIYAYKSDPKRNPEVLTAKNVPTFARFDLAPNRAIFARMDPIRIFVLYPFRVPGTEDIQQLWMPEFAGFVENVSIEDDDIRGKSTITIEAVDIVQAILQRMRITTDLSLGIATNLDFLGFPPTGLNLAGDQPSTGRTFIGPASTPQQQLQQNVKDQTGRFFDPQSTQFYDDVVGTIFGPSFFPNLPMERAVQELLIFKPSKLAMAAPNRGVRAIELGGTFTYDPVNTTREKAQTFFADYHKFCLFGPKRRPWTRREVDEVGKGTTTDGAFNPNSCRLWFMLPSDGTGPKNLADLSTVSTNITHEVNWNNRAEVLRNMIASIDYRAFVTPTGDIVVEFPMADFRPEDFGPEFQATFRVDKALMSSSFGDEQEEPIAGVMVTTGFAVGHGSAGSVVAESNYQRVFAYSPYIAARTGISVETVQLPNILFKDKAIAQQRAVIEFQKRNARCHALNMSFSLRPFLLPNRPLHHLKRTRMGLTVSLDYEYEFGSAPRGGVTAGLEHVRLFTGWYRSPADLQSFNEVQRHEIEDLGGTDPAHMQSIDATTSPDPIALQVYQTVMAGESLPVSSRLGWGTDGKALLAPTAGVYLLDPQARQATETATETAVTPTTATTPAPPQSAQQPPPPDTNDGVDYSQGAPGGAALVKAGKSFVIRYVGLNTGTTKLLTSPELADLLSNNIAVALIVEQFQDDALGGYSKGRALALAVQAHLKQLAVFPPTMPVYFAAEFDIFDTPVNLAKRGITLAKPTPEQFSLTDQYLKGAADVLGGVGRIGVYGSISTINHCASVGSATFFMQSAVGSNGKTSEHAHILQKGMATIGGRPVDLDTKLKDNFGQFSGPG